MLLLHVDALSHEGQAIQQSASPTSAPSHGHHRSRPPAAFDTLLKAVDARQFAHDHEAQYRSALRSILPMPSTIAPRLQRSGERIAAGPAGRLALSTLSADADLGKDHLRNSSSGSPA